LAHLGILYERIPTDIFNRETLTDEYARINPMRSTLVLEFEDGRDLSESNAILLYIAQGTAYLPNDAFGIAQVVRRLIYEQTDVIPMIGGIRFRLLVGRSSPSDPGAIRRRKGAGPVLLPPDLMDCKTRRALLPMTTVNPRRGDPVPASPLPVHPRGRRRRGSWRVRR
jgi:glutathione S-transferase